LSTWPVPAICRPSSTSVSRSPRSSTVYASTSRSAPPLYFGVVRERLDGIDRDLVAEAVEDQVVGRVEDARPDRGVARNRLGELEGEVGVRGAGSAAVGRQAARLHDHRGRVPGGSEADFQGLQARPDRTVELGRGSDFPRRAAQPARGKDPEKRWSPRSYLRG